MLYSPLTSKLVYNFLGRQNQTLHLYVVTATNLDLIQSQRRDVAQRTSGPGGGCVRYRA